MRQKERAQILNRLDRCQGCKELLGINDRIYVEERYFWAVHPMCIPKLPKNIKRAYQLTPMEGITDAEAFIRKLKQ